MKKIVLFALMAMLVHGSQPAAAAQGGVWKWDKALNRDDMGINMIRPLSIFWDSSESRYYVVDTGNGRLISYDGDGNYLKQLRAGGQLNTPVAMARDMRGNIFVVDRKLNVLQYIDLKERAVKSSEVKYPDGKRLFLDQLLVDSLNTMYVLDRSRGRIVRLNHELSVAGEYESDKKDAGFIDFKLKKDGLWALDQRSREITIFAFEGGVKEKISLQREMSFPVSFDVDEHGLIYVLDRHAHKIVAFDRRGEFRYDFLEEGRARGQLYYPNQIMFDAQGRLCVVNEGNGRVDIFKR